MAPFVAQWGILGCGWISSEFTKDACLPMRSRAFGAVTDVSHAIAAVGSRDKQKAEKFIKEWCPNGADGQVEGLVEFKPKAYGSYKEVVEGPSGVNHVLQCLGLRCAFHANPVRALGVNVNIIYVGTPHTSHYDDCKLALDGGKHCLLEKPATLNAAEWKSLSALAKEKGLFLMEAVWTRFNPCFLAIQKAVFDGTIGDIRTLYTEFSCMNIGKTPDTHRAWAAELAGGPLLDLGPYPMVWAMMMLYRHPKNEMTAPEKIGSTMLKYHTGVDLATSWGLAFPKIGAMAHCSTNHFSDTDNARHTRIVGSKGEIIVGGVCCRPNKYTIRRYIENAKEGEKAYDEEVVNMDFPGFGLYWEADAVARNLRDGLTECPEMLHSETQLTMEIFDKIRADGGYKFLPGLEKVQL